MDKVKGTDIVIIGILVWLVYKANNPSPLGGGCIPANIPGAPGPNSSMTGPAWTLFPTLNPTQGT